MSAIQVDALYDVFVNSLPSSLRALAVDLPHVLKLASEPGQRFSEVFRHEVTLGAPFLVAEAFPNLSPELVRCAAMAHAMAVIEAFGGDRIADGQVEPAPDLLALLEYLRGARNCALDLVWPGAAAEAAIADECTREAIAEERTLLGRVAVVDFALYADVSLRKQAAGFPASLALARAAGASARRVQQVEQTLLGVWLGLQFEDDVIDWEEDWQHGGAWAACIARGLRSSAPRDERPTEPDIVRRAVLGTDVLRGLLERARRRYRAAWRHARALGAWRLANWASDCEERLLALIPLEAKYAGYSVRIRKLAPWAGEVLT